MNSYQEAYSNRVEQIRSGQVSIPRFVSIVVDCAGGQHSNHLPTYNNTSRLESCHRALLLERQSNNNHTNNRNTRPAQ